MKKTVTAVVMAGLLCALLIACANAFAGNAITEFYIGSTHRGGTFAKYDENGKKVKVNVEPGTLVIEVDAQNCSENDVYSGILELTYDSDKLICLGADSETGGLWVANSNLPGTVRLAFSTGTSQTEDGIILAAAFDYRTEPKDGEKMDFSVSVIQLCSNKSGAEKYREYTFPDGNKYVYQYGNIDYILGDANHDGNINTADAVVVLKYSADMYPLSDKLLEMSDVNFDGSVNTYDAVIILKYIVGIVAEF